MKKILILFLIIFTISNIFAKDDKDNKKWKRHYIDFCGVTGFSIYYLEFIEYNRISDSNKYKKNLFGIGGNIGLSFAYQYAFTPYFAFGGGLSFFIPFMVNFGAYNVYEYDSSKKNYYDNLSGEIKPYFAVPVLPIPYFMNLTFDFNFMVGDLKDKKLAFLFDIGGGSFFSTRIGFYKNGFVFKIGYGLSISDRFIEFRGNALNIEEIINGSDLCHSINFHIGYKFNF